MVEEKKTAKKKIKKTTVAKKPRGAKKKKAEVIEKKAEVVIAPKTKPPVKPETALAKAVGSAPAKKTISPAVETVKPKPHKNIVRPSTVAYQGTGRRKTAIARVWLKPGKGAFKVNGKSLEACACGRVFLEAQAKRPLVITNTLSSYDVFAKIIGGGQVSQIGALSHGIARALLQVNPDYRKALKIEGLLTRDPRAKERKKYGRKKARKRFQYSKR